MVEGGSVPVIVLDYGRVMSGTPEFTVAAVSGRPTLRASFSESGRYIDADGDNGGNGPCCGAAPPAAEPFRWNEWTPTAAGVLKPTYLQGSQRFVRLALTTPGKLTLSAADIDFKAFRARPADYRGWFLSSDRLLNRIWYAGAYTAQLNMVPPGAQGGNRRPQVVDGAKRDRTIWSGDLVVQNPVIWNTLGRRGAEYVKQSLITLSEGADPSGALPGVMPLNGEGFIYSETYSMHAANTMVDYFRYTGDRQFARGALPVVRRQLDFIAGMTDDRGLLISRPGRGPGLCCGWDWNGPYDGPKAGAVTAANAIYLHSLKQAAYLERTVGDPGRAAELDRAATALRSQINATLFDPATGLYRLSEDEPDETGEDSNALAVLYGVAPRDRGRRILAKLSERLATPFGTRPFTVGTGFSAVISPFINGFETGARFSARDDRGALGLIRRLWGIMVRPGPDYSGALWEKLSPTGGVGVLTGSDPIDNQSLAHGWSASPTAHLSEFVLGATPVEPGYRTWRIEPHLGDLRWAGGKVPTRFGPIRLRWRTGGERALLRGTVRPPAGTRGKLVLPPFARPYRVMLNGRSLGERRALRLKGGRAYRIEVAATRAGKLCRPHWVTAWNFSPSMAVDEGFSDQTIRTISNTHFGGSKVRIVLTNRYGDRPVTFDSVGAGIARFGEGSSSPRMRPGTVRKVTFGGKRSVTLPPGREVRSDPIHLRVERGHSVVTSLYSAGDTGPATIHPESRQVGYVAAGDHSADATAGAFAPIPEIALGHATFFVTRVEVESGGDAATVATIADSLTNGTGSSVDQNGSYPDALARLFAEDRRVSNLAIANAGIGGNELLSDAPDFFPYGGPSVFHRLRQDVFSQPSLAGLLVVAGMNDVGSSGIEERRVSSGEVIAGLRRLARRVHAAGKKIFVGTIPPTGDPEQPSSIPWYSTEVVDRTREEINDFIRGENDFDGYFESARAVSDPEHPSRLADHYDSGDGLHPNDAGYAELARAIKPKMLDGLGVCP